VTFVSYAQNFEDVLLWRALGNIENGSYLDIGAQDPHLHSISLAFYERGWRGIHVEPTPYYAEKLRTARPDETVIQAAVGNGTGLLTLFEFPETGLSTGIADIAKRHSDAGFAGQAITVPQVSLPSLFDKFADQPIHWMKVDVEGMEQSVLQSWGVHPARPWIVLVEATLPNSRNQTHETWQNELLDRGYIEILFDGLNRWYLSSDHPEHRDTLSAAPCVFDDFQITDGHFSAKYLCESSAVALSELERRLNMQIADFHHERESQALLHGEQLAMVRAERDEWQYRHDAIQAELVELIHATTEERRLASEAEQQRVQLAAVEREKHGQQIEDLRQQLENLLQQLNASRDEIRHLHGTATQQAKKLLEADTLIGRALAEPPTRWQRIGRALGFDESDRLRRILLDWAGEKSGTVEEGNMALVTASVQRNPYLRADSLEELLEWDGEDFVRCSYVTMLGRQPDPQGEAYYTNRLRRGYSKMELLWQFRHSSEGRLHDPGIAGLDRALSHARWEKLPVIGSVVRLFINRDIDHRPARVRQQIEIQPERTADGSGMVLSGKPSPNSVDALLSFHDEAFVRHAYVALFGRPVDPDGLAHFLGRVRTGIDRRQILAELFRSPEGRKHRAQIAGLETAIRPFLPRRWNRLFRSRAAELQRRQLLSLINDLYRIEMRHGERLDQLQATLQELVGKAGGRRIPDAIDRRNANARVKADWRRRALSASQPRSTRPRLIYYFVDHTILCPVNTGMQRLVRQLGRCLIDQGEIVRFVKWDAQAKSFILISKAELDHLAQWNGPTIAEGDHQPYTERGGEAVTPPADRDVWLFVPEVTHVTYQQQPPTLDAIMAAKTFGAKIAFIYYDAIPLRLAEYEEGAAAHERYMQSLLLADALIPISRRSATELQKFFVQYQCATTLPHIEPLHLPGESTLSPRSETLRRDSSEQIILTVGSIEPRKNQRKLIEAFEQFSVTPEGRNWRLVLAGHLRGDVAPEVHAAIERNDRISYVPHPLDAELDQLYRSAAFTVFPSVEEGFGLPILESLWHGVPCICANFGAPAEVAEGGGCVTIDTRSVAEIRAALSNLSARPGLLAELSAQAVSRPMTTWADYARSVRSILTHVADPTSHLHLVYFWVDDTCRNPHNSGIQRVVRQLARALIAQGYTLVPVKWADGRLNSVSDEELAHLEKCNGPLRDEWGSWIEPEDSPPLTWLIIPELVHGFGEVRSYAQLAGLRCAVIFYDAIPYKMKEVFGSVFSGHHEDYMEELAKCDKIFSISRHSHNDLKDFLRGRRIRNNSFDHRFEVASNLGPLVENRRATSVKSANGPIQILSVISIEPRKNPITLLRAFAKAVEKSPREMKLTVIGRLIPSFSSIAAEVEAFARETPGFTWLQDISDMQLAGLYAEADFTVFPSLEEGFGLPIIESLWHGRPCLVHEAGAMAEIAEGGGCVSVDMTDSDSLAHAIVSLANDDASRAVLAEAAIRRPIATWDDYARDIMRSMALDRLDDALEPAVSTEAGDIRQELVNLKKRPKLSVCISTYNRGAWLAVNLRNLFGQVPEPLAEVEFLVVDNASEDNTEEVVKPYLHRPDFRFLRNPENVGMLGNLTVTAHEARGEYVWILGDDDLVKSNGIQKVLEVIDANPGVALIYPNYAYTRETSPDNVGDDIQKFLDDCPLLTPACGNSRGTVKDIAGKNENLFTAIYCLILRRDHALRAYSQDTSGRAFSTMRTSIPTTYYVLNYMMDEPAYWIGDILLVVNFNVSWDKYASLQILERVPEAQDLAERLGSEPKEMDRWRENLLPGFVHYWRELFENDVHGNAEFFSPERVVMRMKHLDLFAAIVPEMSEIYERAHANGHRAAGLAPSKLFSAFH